MAFAVHAEATVLLWLLDKGHVADLTSQQHEACYRDMRRHACIFKHDTVDMLANVVFIPHKRTQ